MMQLKIIYNQASEGAQKMEVIGIGYLAIICQNLQESINFYCKGLGFEEIYQETNRDDKESTQVLLMTKSGNGIMLIGPNDPKMKLAEKNIGVGSMQYLTLYVTNKENNSINFD